ncbi:MAG: hypothetical protein GH144_00310 [Clostridia bacterium]|jgi:alpha-galactosidase|nr:hypothetical protein [Clostridia bacterium]
MQKKVILIGAGSAMFTWGLLSDIIRDQSLGPWEIGLVDVDPEALAVAYNLAKKMIDEKDADVMIKRSTDRRDLLRNADVVITTIGVGGREGYKKDVFISRRYGIYHPVGDTVGPAGISRAMRMIPAMKEIAEDILELCPNTLFINYANPMTVICRALRKSTGIKVIGLCIGVYLTEAYLAKLLKVPHQEVTSIAVGVNHLTFLIDFRHKGENAYPKLRQQVKETGKINENPFSWSLFDAYGAYPAVNDRHVTEFFLERFPNGKYYGKTLGLDVISFEKLLLELGDRLYAEMAELSKPGVSLGSDSFSKFIGEHRQTIEIITSIYKDQRKIFSANLPNDGAIPNLPSYAVLEMPAVATGVGFCPLHISHFPDSLAAIINERLTCVELTVEAAFKGDRKIMVEAILADGAVRNRSIAEKLTDELLKAHKEFLPQFL